MKISTLLKIFTNIMKLKKNKITIKYVLVRRHDIYIAVFYYAHYTYTYLVITFLSILYTKKISNLNGKKNFNANP